MTALRRDTYRLLERMPEDRLYFLVEIMRGIDNLLKETSPYSGDPSTVI